MYTERVRRESPCTTYEQREMLSLGEVLVCSWVSLFLRNSSSSAHGMYDATTCSLSLTLSLTHTLSASLSLRPCVPCIAKETSSAIVVLPLSGVQRQCIYTTTFSSYAHILAVLLFFSEALCLMNVPPLYLTHIYISRRAYYYAQSPPPHIRLILFADADASFRTAQL